MRLLFAKLVVLLTLNNFFWSSLSEATCASTCPMSKLSCKARPYLETCLPWAGAEHKQPCRQMLGHRTSDNNVLSRSSSTGNLYQKCCFITTQLAQNWHKWSKMPPLKSVCPSASSHGFSVIRSNTVVHLPDVDLQNREGGLTPSSSRHTCRLRAEGLSFPTPPVHGLGFGSLREAALLCEQAGELWWAEASLRLGPNPACQFLQLASEGKRGRSSAHPLTAGLCLPWRMYQLMCSYCWRVTVVSRGQGG